ncbi:AimR family lysis-lysogeny pheromone receptor [Bacillus cereus]
MLILCDLGDFALIESYKRRIEENILLVTNEYLEKLYKFWIYELWSYSNLRKDYIVEFEKQNKKLRKCEDLKFFPVMESLLNIRSGESFMFSSYQKSLMYFEESLKILEHDRNSLKYSMACNDINFIRIFWWRDIDKLEFNTLHRAEYALYLIKIGKKHEAVLILEALEKENKQLTALQTCYLGMAKDDLKLIVKSINMFKSNNDFLYGKFAEYVYNEYLERTI